MIKIKLESILYNNDINAIKYLKDNNLYDVKDYEKEIEKNIVNEINIEINEDDTIDYLLKKISHKLFSELENDKNKKDDYCCFYCFSRENKETKEKNEIIKVKKNISISKIKTQEEIDDIEIEDEMSDIELEDELSEISDLDLSDITDMEGGNNSKSKNNIFICKNCKKIYFFNKYFDFRDTKLKEYNDIFPLPELFYLRNNEKKLSFNLIDNQRKTIEYKYNDKNIESPYNVLNEINKTFLSKDKKNSLYKYLDAYSLNNNKDYKYLNNNSFMLLNNFNYENLTITYFPELCLYKKNNEYKMIDLYSKLYYPNVNFENYYLKFINQITKDNYKKGLLKNFELNKRTIDDSLEIYTVEQLVSEFYGENDEFEGWGIEIENQKIIEDEVKKINSDIKTTKYFNKIFYKINDNVQNTSLINFTLLYHLFELDEEIPYFISYLAEEGVMLEKYYKPLENKIKDMNINIKNKKIIRFLVKMPEEILKDKYFFVNLYENLKVEVTIILPNEIQKYVNEKELQLINNKVNELIKRINNINVFTFNDVTIPLSENDMKNWNKTNTSINSLNINFLLDTYDIENIEKKMIDLSKCFKNTFIKDFNNMSNNFRYIKINNIDLGVLTDRYIFYKIKEIYDIDNTKTDEEIKDYVILNMMKDFQKNFPECFNIYKNYVSKYKNVEDQFRNPINYGVYFNIKRDEDTKKYIINIFGLRNYKEIEKMEKFFSNIFYIFKNPSDDNVKKILNTCNILIQKEKEVISEIGNDLINLNKKSIKCVKDINELKNSKEYKKNKTSYDKKIKELIKIRKELIKKIENKEKITKHTKILKRLQDTFPNLKFRCGDKNTKQYTKRCQGKKQPMGTGSGIYEDVVDFNPKYEEERLKKIDNYSCSLEQTGGNKNDIGKYRFIDYCYHYNFILNKRKTFIECYTEIINGDAKGKKEIQKIANEVYGLDSTRKKIGFLLEEIKNKIMSSKVDFSNYNIYLDKVIKEGDDFLINYYSSRIHKYSLDIKENLDKFSLDLLNKKVDKYTLFKYIIDEICINNNKKVLNDIIDFLDIKDLVKILVDKKISLKIFFIYIVDYMFNIKTIKKSEYDSIFQYLNININENNKIILDSELTKFYETTLLLNKEIGEKKMETKEEVDETSLKELMSEVNDLIIKKDKNNHITDSILNYKGKALTCPNYADDNNPNKPLIGFLDISKFSNKDNLNDNEIRDLVCQPCCFVQKYDDEKDDHIITKRYRKNMLFCKSKISWNKYLDLIENETRIEGYIYSESLNINNTFGILPKNLYNLFNNFINLLNKRLNIDYDNFLFKEYNNSNRVLKGYGYVLRGYEQKNNIIMTLLEDLLKINKNKLIKLIKNKLLNTDKLFETLNNGRLKIKFKDINTYIEYLNGENIDINWVVDIISQPNVLDNYKEGINIILLEKEDEEDDNSDINIIEYKYIDMTDYYDKNKNTIFLYKYKSGEIEPIVLKNDKLYSGVFSKDKIEFFNNVNKKYNVNIKIYIEEFLDIIDRWINDSFKTNYITSKKMIKKYDIKEQLVDKFYNVIYILDKNNNLIPVLPSSIDLNYKFNIFNTVNDLDKYLKNYEDTYNYLVKLSKELKLENYLPEKIILDDNKKNIIGIELRNNLIIPTKEEKYNKNKDYNISRISNKFLFFKINNVLYDNIKIKEDIEFIKEKYDIEIYQRFLLEVGNYLNKNQDDKKEVMKLINMKNREDIKNKFNNIFDKITLNHEDDLINYKDIKDTDNIRKICDVENNKVFCKENKLIIPYSKKNLIYGLFIENIINNNDFRIKLLDNKINKIIDITKFIDDDKHKYIKKDVDF